MKTDYRFANAVDRRGASLGRDTIIGDPSVPAKLQLRRVRLDGGGYDPGGAYWGLGEALWVAWGDDVEIFVRALTREDAKLAVRRLKPLASYYN